MGGTANRYHEGMRFSERTSWELGENAFAGAIREARASGRELLDLTLANPTVCGFDYQESALLGPLSEQAAFAYEPSPLGLTAARAAVAEYYSAAGSHVDVGQLCLTTSTSEAYSYLFRLLCDPGDEVLVASPSYPLFDFIARLDNVRLVEYPLLHDPHAGHGWLIDLQALRSAISQRTRAILVVHPNNPTGHFCSLSDRAALQALCAQHNLALIVDEVFLDYGLPGTTAVSFAAASSPALTFVLSGLSKVCGLPQMKCSWIAATGPAAQVAAAMERLEVIADTFLSMNTPVQHALTSWLGGRDHIQTQIRSRMIENLAQLDKALAGSHCNRLSMEAGWTAVLRVPRTIDGVDFCTAALGQGIMGQPGEFYGLPAGRVVLSLLTPPDVWRKGVALLAGLA